jgi:hypothetical protein
MSHSSIRGIAQPLDMRLAKFLSGGRETRVSLVDIKVHGSESEKKPGFWVGRWEEGHRII